MVASMARTRKSAWAIQNDRKYLDEKDFSLARLRSPCHGGRGQKCRPNSRATVFDVIGAAVGISNLLANLAHVHVNAAVEGRKLAAED